MNFMSNEDRQGMRSFSQSYSTPSSSSSSLPHVLSLGHGLREQRGWLEDGCASPTVTPNNAEVVEREHMFDKVVTPSDVGKLNRLVIPKQHAEKYFPLDSSTNEKGLLLNFEDRNGKPWRFRYSYWNSSQSYVMTKGWSRFVKDKKLDAGDIVSFHRGIGELGKDRLFIDWRRRPNPQLTAIPGISHLPNHFPGISHLPNHFPFHRSVHHQSYPVAAQAAASAAAAWNYHHAIFVPPPPPAAAGHSHSHTSYGYNNWCGGPNYPLTSQFNTTAGGSVIYHRSGGEEVAAPPNRGGAVYESVPVVQGKAAAKRLRLFGVNMDCPIPESDDCDPSSSSAPLIPFSSYHHISPSSYGDGPSDLDSPIDKAKTSSSMSLDLDI